jgi:hypothetical protein
MGNVFFSVLKPLVIRESETFSSQISAVYGGKRLACSSGLCTFIDRTCLHTAQETGRAQNEARSDSDKMLCGVIGLLPVSYMRGIQFNSQQMRTIKLITISLIALIQKMKGEKKVKLSMYQAVKAHRFVRRRGSHIFFRQSAHRWR